MTANCETSHFYSPFCMRAARVTGSSAEGFDAQNLTKGSLPWKATGISASLQVQFPSSVSVSALILAASNLSYGATITLTPDGGDDIVIDCSRFGPEPVDCFDSPGGSLEPAALINDVGQIGDGVTAVYLVGGGAGLNVAELQVFIDGVRQVPTDDYAVADAGFDLAVTFVSAPPDDAILHFYAATELLAGAGVDVNEVQIADGITAAYTITGPAGILATEIEVFIDGVRQIPDADYSLSGMVVTFDDIPGAGARLFFIANFESTQSPGFGPRVMDGAQVGTGATVVYTVDSAAGVTQNALEVFIDGIRQRAGVDYRSTSLGLALAVTFTSPPPDDAVLLFYAHSEINAAVGYDVQSEEWPRRNIIDTFPEVTSGLWDIVISDPGNRDGQLRALRLILGSPRQSEHIQDGWSITPKHVYGAPTRTLSGAVISPSSEVYRVLSIKTTLMGSENAYAEMRRDLALGLNQELFVVPCPDDPAMIEATSFLGKPIEIPPTQSRGQFSRWSRPLVLEELF